MKSYSIFIPKGRGERGGWFTMTEMLRSMGVVIGRRERKQEETLPLKPILEKSYAKMVKMPRSRGRDLVRVEFSERRRFGKIGDSNGKSLGAERREKKCGLGKNCGVTSLLMRSDHIEKGGEECSGFLSVDSQMEKMEELQWARILVKTNGEDLPNALEIWIEEVCYSLILWWEIRPSLRKASFDSRGKTNSSRDEVGVMLTHALACVWWKKRVTRGSRFCSGQLKGRVGRPISGFKLKGVAVAEDVPSSSKDFWWASEEENNTTIGIDDLDGESSPDPSQLLLVDRAQNVMAHSPAWSGPRNWSNSKSEFIKLWVTEGMRKQLVEEQQTVERSKTDQALVEEALRYGDDFVSWRKRDSRSSPSHSFSIGRTPMMGEYYDFSGAVSEAVQGEIPLCMVTASRITKGVTTACWDLIEVNNVVIRKE
ncbi:hypothetical protein CK203_081278 [Vitis vinifera]|uniref:DUF4283 domain-containing protein n=1 Tax=Vitis vinifera TaxID=29760 RepID=A0A438DAH7_VITVI|nr:hypothetical protein CK203_081278 [Vitis vinifera]